MQAVSMRNVLVTIEFGVATVDWLALEIRAMAPNAMMGGMTEFCRRKNH